MLDLIGAGFLIWVFMTIVGHVSRRTAGYLARIDCFAVVPLWKFFAPDPTVVDYHLFYRDRSGSGDCGPLTEVTDCVPTRGLVTWVWNPRRRMRKVIMEALTELILLEGRLDADDFGLTVPYSVLANYVTALPVAGDARDRQFVIVARPGFDEAHEPDLAFVSDFHPIRR